MRPTKAIVNLRAIKENVRMFAASTPHSRLMAVVKADAYGHGAVPVARAAIEAGATYLGVALMEEGQELRRAGIQVPILVLGAPSNEDCAQCVRDEISACAFLPEQIYAMEEAAKACGKMGKAHLKIDSGFHRIGVYPEDLGPVLEAFKACEHVEMEGIFTHFATADEPDDSFVDQQFAVYEKAVQIVREAGFSPMTHVSNSAAGVRRHAMGQDMVREGIILYGCVPSVDTPLGTYVPQPALSLVSEVSAVKRIQKGETVGYGRKFTAPCESVIATIPIGYADGYGRCMGNTGSVLIHGTRCPIVGRVCMDQMMVDVTKLQDVKRGDEVVMIGKQGDEQITAEEVGLWRGTIGHEVLTTLGRRVPREYVE